MESRQNLSHEVVSDGRAVWVNTSVCLGRFSRFGVDVHQTAEKQLEGEQQCLDCSTTPDWDRFKASMLTHHGIVVDDKHCPDFAS